ncbi:hypothetical protein [Mycetocola manganoxydans]|nr:hypothetical protein [Mycetocola manganoxydans]
MLLFVLFVLDGRGSHNTRASIPVAIVSRRNQTASAVLTRRTERYP